LEAIRSALIEGEASGEPRRFDATAFKHRMLAAHG
jgi:antitoxin ParD1/3/4